MWRLEYEPLIEENGTHAFLFLDLKSGLIKYIVKLNF